MKKKVFVIVLIIISLFCIVEGKTYESIKTFISNKIYMNNLSVQRKNNYDKMKIDSFNLKSRRTGTVPFNNLEESNTLGVDVNDSDDYVRTFDYVKYEFEVGIVPNNDISGVNDISSFRGGVIKVKAKLPNQQGKILMTWEEDAWMRNIVYNSDKTEITAEYYISNNINVTHSIQTLSFTLKVNGYKSEITDSMMPIFEVWMEGNKPDNKSSTVESLIYKDKGKLIISARPSYDVDLKASTYIYSGKKGDTIGQYISYGVGVALIQPYDYIDDLRGVEFPTGKFDVELENSYLAKNSESNGKYFDITTDTSASLVAYSKNYSTNKNYYMASNVHTRNLPKGSGGGAKGVSNSGKILASLDNNITNIAFDNYTLNNKYPIRNIVALAGTITYNSNLGYIMAGNVQLFVPYYDIESSNLYDYRYTTKVSKIKYYDCNGTLYELNGNDELKNNNNSISINFNKKNSGSFYVASGISHNNTASVDGLASAEIGEYIEPTFTLMPVTGPYDSSLRFIAWNSNYFELVKKNDSTWVNVVCTSELGYNCPNNETFKLKYGIYKENRNGLLSDNLVNSVYFDDFYWYDTVEEAMENGTVTALYGLDSEVVGNRVHRKIQPKFKIRENVDLIGTVGMFVHRCKIYDIDKNIIYEPNKNKKYVKTTYNNDGVVVKKHNGYEVGLSVLILGNKTGITTTVTDKDENSGLKQFYDVTDKEINVKLIPTLTNDSNSEVLNNYSDTVIVQSTLPMGLSYIDNSSNKAVKTILNNQDGSTTLVWEYDNWMVGNQDEITYKAEISSAVNNNTYLNINSIVYTKNDLRDIRYRNSDYTIYISNLSSGSRTIKKIDKTVLDVGESFIITNVIENISVSKLENVKTLEVLPKDGYNGNYKIEVLELNEKQKLYYSINSLDELEIIDDVNGRKIINNFDNRKWIEVNNGDIIPENATALLSIVEEINNFNSVSFKYNIVPNGNKSGDKYSFSMNVISSNLSVAVKSNTVVTNVVDRSISGLVFIDNNNNDSYDTEDEYFKNINVYLLNSNYEVIDNCVTNILGIYNFSGLTKGKYYVKFDVPSGYKVIDINDNKAFLNGITDIIDLDSVENIDNINLGLQLKKVNVITHYYYENTTNSISDDKIYEYLYGQYYKTYELEDVPINYELKGVVNAREGIINSDKVEVIYYYGIKNSIIIDSIENKTADVLNSLSDYLEYEINYNVTIKDYIGSANIVITDILPYDIDVSKSDLDGGIYNSQDKSITWIKNIEDINTYDSDFNISVRKSIKLVYKDINLVDNTINANVVCKTVLSNNESVKNTVINTLINVPNIIVPDNIRRSVISPVINDSEVNTNGNSIIDNTEIIENKKNTNDKSVSNNRRKIINNDRSKIVEDDVRDNVSDNLLMGVYKYIWLLFIFIMPLLFFMIIFGRRKKEEEEN